jgi:hypothetical protein
MIYHPLIIFFLVLLISIIFHEFGHWIYIKRQTSINMKLVFVFNWLKTRFEMQLPNNLTNNQILNTALFGISFGLVPILLIIFFGKWHYYVFLLPIYMAGCNHDIKEMFKIIKKENKEIFGIR